MLIETFLWHCFFSNRDIGGNEKSFAPFQVRGNDEVTELSLPPNFGAWCLTKGADHWPFHGVVSTNYYWAHREHYWAILLALRVMCFRTFFWVDETLIFCLLQKMKNVKNDLKYSISKNLWMQRKRYFPTSFMRSSYHYWFQRYRPVKLGTV